MSLELIELAAMPPPDDASAGGLARLAPDDREHVAATLAANDHPSDHAKDAANAAAFGAAGPAVSARWQARGERDIAELWPIVLALLPGLLRVRVWTGDDLEHAIARLATEAPA